MEERQTTEETRADAKCQNYNFEFCKVIREFTPDFLNTFPEYKTNLHLGIQHIMNSGYVDEEQCLVVSEEMIELYKHSISVLPERFFDILYQNEEIMTDIKDDSTTEFIKGIYFSQLWSSDITDNTKQILWKYLQLLLFSLVTDMKEKHTFGDAEKLFEAIHEDEFKKKLEETMENIHTFFDASANTSSIPKEDLPDPEKIHEHIEGIMGGKIGSLAKELAEETLGELDIESDLENIKDNMDSKDAGQYVFQKLFKNPSKLMNITKKIGSKLDSKIKSGELKESELMEEATNLMSKMKDMPGMGNMSDLFKSMGGSMGGFGGKSKMNFGAMQNFFDKSQKQEQMRQKLQERLKKRTQPTNSVSDSGVKTTDKTHDVHHTLSGSGTNQKFTIDDVVQKTPRVNKKKNKNKKKKNK
jgi:hypothetical protein